MRLELIHPMLVHFPIALSTTGVLLRFAALWAGKKPKYSFLLPASWSILLLGLITAWASVIAGEIAEGIVGSTVNRDILEEHETHAYITASFFTFVLFIDWARFSYLNKFLNKRRTVKRGLALVIWFLYLFCLTNLIITGYYGANLVYEEGAAVSRK